MSLLGENTQGIKYDLFPEILKEEAVARLNELGKVLKQGNLFISLLVEVKFPVRNVFFLVSYQSFVLPWNTYNTICITGRFQILKIH